MGGESSGSSTTSSSLEDSLAEMGSQRELISMRNVQLYLIDGEESMMMQSGEFSLKLLKQSHSPLAVVVANVGEVQWPVGKDAPVLKLFHRRYTFALPGLVYGMILPESTPVSALHTLEVILAEYSTFETHPEIASAHPLAARDQAGYWNAVAPEVETLSSRVARSIDSTSTIVANSIVLGGDWAALGIKHGASLLKRKGPDSPPGRTVNDGGVSPRMMKRMQQARRMSAVAKLMSRTLLKGAISADGHVARTLGLDGNSNSSPPVFERNVAVASVDAFGKVVEAVETAGKSLYDATSKHGGEIVQERFGAGAGQVLQEGLGAVGNVINTAWTLNKMGVRMLLRMTAASTVLNTQRLASTTSTVTSESSPSSTGTKSIAPSHHHLRHQITLSPDEVPRLQTTQLFPTSAEQMRTHNQHSVVQGIPAASPLYVPPGNFTTIIPPAGPRANSPFQQYHPPSAQQQPPFSFQQMHKD